MRKKGGQLGTRIVVLRIRLNVSEAYKTQKQRIAPTINCHRPSDLIWSMLCSRIYANPLSALQLNTRW